MMMALTSEQLIKIKPITRHTSNIYLPDEKFFHFYSDETNEIHNSFKSPQIIP